MSEIVETKNIIKAIKGNHANGEWHFHKVDFQMVFILRGKVKFEYKGHGEFTLYPGDTVYQPKEIHHREIEHSDDLELIEITSPAQFETISLK